MDAATSVYATERAAEKGRVDVLEFLESRLARVDLETVYGAAARGGQFAVLRWLAAHLPRRGDHFFGALFRGLSEYLKRRISRGRAAESEAIAVVQWFSHFFDVGHLTWRVLRDVLADALWTGSLGYVHELTLSFGLKNALRLPVQAREILMIISASDSIDLMEWAVTYFDLRFSRPILVGAFASACGAGRLEMAQWLVERSQNVRGEHVPLTENSRGDFDDLDMASVANKAAASGKVK